MLRMARDNSLHRNPCLTLNHFESFVNPITIHQKIGDWVMRSR